MTNEQLTEYERLDNAVQVAHDNLTGEIILLAQMSIRKNENVLDYVSRVENAVASINACKRELAKASGDKTAFLRTV
jgi:hypothetical protein